MTVRCSSGVCQPGHFNRCEPQLHFFAEPISIAIVTTISVLVAFDDRLREPLNEFFV
jgi:hypothetical protein